MINQCIILCGGYGTRLKSITKKTPKPLIRYYNKEFLAHVIDRLEHQGIEEVILLTYYKNQQFKKFINKINKNKLKKLKIKVVCEKDKLGTGGALINSIKFQNDSFFLLNGDTFFDINLREFEKNSRIKDKLVSIAAISTLNKKKITRPNYLIKNKILKKIYFSNSKKIIKSGGTYIVNKKILEKYQKFKLTNLDFDKDIIHKNLNTKKIISIVYKKNFIDIGENLKVFKRSQKLLKKMIYKPCCFLDRDGVINYDKGYTYKIKDFLFRPKVEKAIKFLNNNGYFVVIVTNQSGIARGFYNIKDLNILHSYMLKKLYESGAYIDKIYFSPFHINGNINKYKKNSIMRKPNIGMLNQCKKELNFNRSKSFLIGDKSSDIQTAKKFKIKGYFVESNLLKQVRKIVKNN